MCLTATYLSKHRVIPVGSAQGSQCVDFHRLWVRPELWNRFVYIAANTWGCTISDSPKQTCFRWNQCTDHHV